MYSNKILIIFLFALVASSVRLAAQVKSDTLHDELNVNRKGTYALVVYAGGGIFNYMSSVGSSGTGFDESIVRWNASGTFRLIWQPDHRLRVGIESGYVNFYSYELKNGSNTGKLRLSGVPLLLEASMAITKRINVFAGTGYYFLETHLNYNGEVKSNAPSLGYMAALNYVQPLSKKFGLAGEIKWMDATQTRDNGLSAQILLVWKFLEW